MRNCCITCTKLKGWNCFAFFTYIYFAWRIDDLELILYNPEFFETRVKPTFSINIFHMVINHFKNFWKSMIWLFSTASFKSNNKSWTNGCFVHLRKPVRNWKSFIFVINMNVKLLTISNFDIYDFFLRDWNLKIYSTWCIIVEPNFRHEFCYVELFTNENKLIRCFVNGDKKKSTMQFFQICFNMSVIQHWLCTSWFYILF